MRIISALFSAVSAMVFYIGYMVSLSGHAGQTLSETQGTFVVIAPVALAIAVFSALGAVMPNDKK
jgi:formate hydrogenlyase subunit 3/multisubunit Na+/H+ antiporter MnhD subunit